MNRVFGKIVKVIDNQIDSYESIETKDSLGMVKTFVQSLEKEFKDNPLATCRDFGRDNLGRCKMRGCNKCDEYAKQIKNLKNYKKKVLTIAEQCSFTDENQKRMYLDWLKYCLEESMKKENNNESCRKDCSN